jgi:hypothetical protein
MTSDNASSNDVQADALYALENSFDEANCVHCFNHTIQLSGKALIKPFNAGMGKVNSNIECDDVPSLEGFEEHEDDTDGDVDIFEDRNEDDDNSETLSEEDQVALMDDTSAVRDTVSKVCRLADSSLIFY